MRMTYLPIEPMPYVSRATESKFLMRCGVDIHLSIFEPRRAPKFGCVMEATTYAKLDIPLFTLFMSSSRNCGAIMFW